jgi:hypothetical protein
MRDICRFGAMLLVLLTCNVLAQAEELSGNLAALSVEDKPLPEWFRKVREHVSLTGYMEAVHSARFARSDDPPSSRARLHLENKVDFGTVYGFLSANAEKNWAIPDETGVELQELWVEYVGEGWDLRVGRQIIIWGKADGVQVTDLISPPDYTEAMTRDLDDIRIPVDAAKLRFTGIPVMGRDFNLELIAIPVFRQADLPEGDNPWAIERPMPAGMDMYSADKPNASIKNMELAAKVSGFFSGLDVAVSIFHTWDDMPAYFYSVENGIVHIRPDYKRMTVAGLEFSRPWSDFVFRGEAAWYFGRYRAATDTNPMRRDSLKWLLGLDWTPGDDWTVGVQTMTDSIFNYHPAIEADAYDSLLTLSVSKKMYNQLLTVSNMVFVDANDGDFYNRIKAEYELADGFYWSVGLDYFSGGTGQYGVYHDNSFVLTKVKYSF